MDILAPKYRNFPHSPFNSIWDTNRLDDNIYVGEDNLYSVYWTKY